MVLALCRTLLLFFAVMEYGGIFAFWEGTPAYNLTNFLLAVVGLILTIVGFLFTLYQLRKTKGAAEAAQDATQHTREKLKELTAFIDLKTLGNHAREVAGHVSTSNLHSVSLRSADLRDGVARARAATKTRDLMKPSEWQETISKIVSVHAISGEALMDGRELTPNEQAESFRLINEVADLLHQLSALVETKVQQ